MVLKLNQILSKILICFSLMIAWNNVVAFNLVVKSEGKVKNLKVYERNLTTPTILKAGANDIELEHYPNAVLLLNQRSASKFEYLSFIWVSSDTSTIEISINDNNIVGYTDLSPYQLELNKIFESSNKWSLFPYEPSDDFPLEPILALEAKALITNLKAHTSRDVLSNLLKLGQKRGIDNWSTDVLTSYLKELPGYFYNESTKKLSRIHGLDSLENKIELEPGGKDYLMVIASGSWCGPCIKGLADIKKVYDNVNEKVSFVSLWNDSDLNMFVNNHRDKKQVISWTNLWDQYGLMANALRVQAYPSYILFDPQGNEIKRWDGKFPNDLEEYYLE
ncbi:MAG: TlpA family protein disulfide reductase [Bacteroidota bacterium]